jgi:phage/plasmid-like protein (TIGR03299 family)
MSNPKAWFRKNIASICPTTSDMAIQQFGIDFEVALHAVKDDVTGKLIPYQFSSTRKDNDISLGIVGYIYRHLQNADAFKMCDDLVLNNIATYLAGGQFGQGERTWLLMKRPDFFEVVPGDEVHSYIGVFNSHDGNSSLFIMPLAVRGVSDVTLNVSFKVGTIVKIKHTTNIQARVSNLHQAVRRVDLEFKELEKASKLLATKKMDDAAVDKFMKQFLTGLNNIKVHPKTTSMYESIIRYFEQGTGNQIAGVEKSAWAMLNAVCEWADYDKSTRVMDDHSDEDTQRCKSILFGDGAKKKQVALDLLLKV